jgi:hypothetical protein
MRIAGRLKSNGVMQVYSEIDELSNPTRNAGISSEGIMYGSLFDENLSLEIQSNTPLRIKSDKKIIAYNYFDERTLRFNEDMFGSLLSLSVSLNSITSVTDTDFKNVQSTIELANPVFNVFAVATKNYNSEALPGFGSATGKYTFTSPGFSYNTSNSNILSTGKEIVNMSNGAGYGLPTIDVHKWMAAAIYDGTTNGFRGILLWIFTNDIIDDTIFELSVIIPNGKIVTSTKSIFDPTLNKFNYMRMYQVVIDPSGNVINSDTTGNAGWGYSDNQVPNNITGYYSTSQFSFDDGLWAYVLGGKVDGNDGPDYRTANGYGFGNYNNSDSSARLYWAGDQVISNNYVGFIFTGDA